MNNQPILIKQCCQCKRVQIDGKWGFPRYRLLIDKEISHGYCEDCFSRQMEILATRAEAKRHNKNISWWSRVARISFSQ